MFHSAGFVSLTLSLHVAQLALTHSWWHKNNNLPTLPLLQHTVLRKHCFKIHMVHRRKTYQYTNRLTDTWKDSSELLSVNYHLLITYDCGVFRFVQTYGLSNAASGTLNDMNQVICPKWLRFRCLGAIFLGPIDHHKTNRVVHILQIQCHSRAMLLHINLCLIRTKVASGFLPY